MQEKWLSLKIRALHAAWDEKNKVRMNNVLTPIYKPFTDTSIFFFLYLSTKDILNSA